MLSLIQRQINFFRKIFFSQIFSNQKRNSFFLKNNFVFVEEYLSFSKKKKIIRKKTKNNYKFDKTGFNIL